MEIAEGNNLLNNLRVLYVEDEEFTRMELSRFLKRRVGKLYVAKSGLEGLQMCRGYEIDLIITDLKMPYMDGVEMIREIRQLGYNCPIIVISALSDCDTILQAVDMGIIKYVIKPVNPGELIVTMEKASLDLLKNRFHESVIQNSILLDKDKKQEFEKRIKSEVAYFLKNHTGKGPRDVHVFIQGNQIEIAVQGVLSLLEKSLVSNGRNSSLVDYMRKTFYTEKSDVLRKRIDQIIGSKVGSMEVYCCALDDTDKITFSFS